VPHAPPVSLRQHGTFRFILCFVFALYERKNEIQKEDKVPPGACHPAETISAELVPYAQAIRRLEENGGWPGIQEPQLAYLRGDAQAGTIWFYREEQGVQSLVASIASLQ